MTYYFIVLCVLGVHTGPVVGENLLSLVSLEDHPMAQCNDGTPAVYYRKPLNTFQETRKVLIYLQGGGFCVPYVPGARYLYLIALVPQACAGKLSSKVGGYSDKIFSEFV